MSKLNLKPNPTFSALVLIPVSGAEPTPVQFTFKHRDRKELAKYMDELKEMGDASAENDLAIVKKVASGWELDDDFNDENISALVNSYHGSAWAIANTYISELVAAKRGN